MSFDVSSISRDLSHPTQFFGLKLWIAIVIFIALLIFVLLFTSLCSSSCRRHRRKKLDENLYLGSGRRKKVDGRLLPLRGWDVNSSPEEQAVFSDRSPWSGGNIHLVHIEPAVIGSAGRCKNYPASEMQLATDGFSYGNLIGSGEHGVVYRGVLLDNRRVAVKQLKSKSDKVEEFIEEVEAIWCIRHRNLVKLLGYSIEGTKRMIVYEYVDNGNLHQWLHGCIARISPLTWNIRMKIILGITKGLAYLHEDSEPIVIHRHLKSSSILLDHHWNPRISGISVTKFLDPGWSHSITPSPLTSGYIAPEYTLTHNFDEKGDVYSFGVLVMEIISGRAPVEYTGFETKEYLVEWLKSMVSDQKFNDIADPKLQEPPSSKELKRIILIALRCVDSDVENRPTMGAVIHMLEPRDLLLNDEPVIQT